MMAGPIRLLLVGCAVALTALPGASRALPVAAPRALAAGGLAAVAVDSFVAALDSVSATGDSTKATLDSLEAPALGDDPVALGAWLDRIRLAGAGLPGNDRIVFDELLEAAREMLATGDPEATRLLAADALEVLRRESP